MRSIAETRGNGTRKSGWQLIESAARTAEGSLPRLVLPLGWISRMRACCDGGGVVRQVDGRAVSHEREPVCDGVRSGVCADAMRKLWRKVRRSASNEDAQLAGCWDVRFKSQTYSLQAVEAKTGNGRRRSKSESYLQCAGEDCVDGREEYAKCLCVLTMCGSRSTPLFSRLCV